MATTEVTQALLKAIEAGNADVAPSSRVQGAALQSEDLDNVMKNVCFEDKHVFLQNNLSSKKSKSNMFQFTRQLSYGAFGDSAVFEGQAGQDETSDWARITVPMGYYAHVRRVSIQSTMVETFDGVNAEERARMDATMKIKADVEFDSFRGMSDFSNAGVFDGNDAVIADLPGMKGIECQIRSSDGERNAHDLMFGEYGSDDSVVINGGGVLNQTNVEDATMRSSMNFGSADKLLLDPKTLSAYNLLTLGKERVMLSGSALEATGSNLKRQHTSNGDALFAASRFLSGKTRPRSPRNNPSAAVAPTGVVAAAAGGTTTFDAGNYWYFVTACNELGESSRTAIAGAVAVAAGGQVALTITPSGAGGWASYFNVYRSAAGGALNSARFIGRVRRANAATTVFTDLNNRHPGFVTGMLLDYSTMAIRELAGYQSVKLAMSALNIPEAHLRFLCVAMFHPRKNIILDNLVGRDG